MRMKALLGLVFLSTLVLPTATASEVKAPTIAAESHVEAISAAITITCVSSEDGTYCGVCMKDDSTGAIPVSTGGEQGGGVGVATNHQGDDLLAGWGPYFGVFLNQQCDS